MKSQGPIIPPKVYRQSAVAAHRNLYLFRFSPDHLSLWLLGELFTHEGLASLYANHLRDDGRSVFLLSPGETAEIGKCDLQKFISRSPVGGLDHLPIWSVIQAVRYDNLPVSIVGYYYNNIDSFDYLIRMDTYLLLPDQWKGIAIIQSYS